MPSSPGYVRDYKQEHKTAIARGEQGTGHNGDGAKRARFRRDALKRGAVKKGQDLDHRVPLSKGGPNTASNDRAESPGANRSFPRNPDGSMIANHPTAKEKAKLGRK
jgi:hypothetical protein